MLERGADPIIGICVFTGGLAKHEGHSASTALRKADPLENVKVTLAEIIPATKVPWPPFEKFEQPNPSRTKSSQPTTELSRLICGKPGRMPESTTATMTPCPMILSAWSVPALLMP